MALGLIGVFALSMPLTAGADSDAEAVVAPALLQAALAAPDAAFDIIVQGEQGSGAVAAKIDGFLGDSLQVEGLDEPPAPAVERHFVTIPGVATTLTGEQIVALASSGEPLVITPDSPLTAADAPVATEAPTILGAARQGELLTAAAGAWTGSPPLTYSFRWQRCDPSGDACADIVAATGTVHALVSADVGSAVRVVVTASGSESSGSASSAPTPVVAAATPSANPVPAAPANRQTPIVSGDVETGRPLTATPGVWTGSGTLSYSYQWQRCRSRFRSSAMRTPSPVGYWRLGELEGQVAADASGRGLHGVYSGGVSYGAEGVTDDGDTAVSLDPTASIVVPAVQGGTFASGFSLEAWVKLAGAQRDRGVIASGRFEYGGGFRLWLDEEGNYGLAAGGATPIRLRTSATPTVGEWEHLVGTWDGARLRLYRNGVELGVEEFSGPLSRPTTDLIIGSYPGASESLSGTVDEVAVYDQALPAHRVQSHYLGCDDISTGNNKIHWVNAKSIGSRLRAVVTASSSAGSKAAASDLTAVVYARPPAGLSPPAIVGTAEEGQTLAAAVGVWDGTPPFSYTYQWQRCMAGGEDCNDVTGATGSRYTIGPDSAGTTIRLSVTARNLGGRSSASSSPTHAVGGIPEPLAAFRQHWPYVTGIASLHADAQGRPEPPTIAIVDSGIDAFRADFAGRVIEEVTLTDRVPNSPGDGNGHGTAVASMAAGGAEGYTGAAPDARLVSIDVLDDDGIANTSDVIAAADWIYTHKDRLNIRVANFSLHGTTLASITSDPLNKAIERLWLSGVVVVAAAGNYAVGGEESAVAFAPANDPFVLTVGAIDTGGSFTQRDDVAAPWSAWGYTRDGFAKPELGAPGRYIAAAVSPDAKLARERPERTVEPGYLQLSGTSLAAPIVAGSAAIVAGKHPDWTPDQVKGALMLTAQPLPRATWRSSGVGAVNAARAAAVADPPNPNLALREFLVPDPNGGSVPVFDAAEWTRVVESDPAWASVAWGSVAWGSSAWSSVAWGSVAWGSVAWGSVAWGSVAWGSVAWGSDAKNDVRADGGYRLRRN